MHVDDSGISSDRARSLLPAPEVAFSRKGCVVLKVLAWIVGIIFLIGLLVVIGVFDFIL